MSTMSSTPVTGPSPRVRGSPDALERRQLGTRSIPACAGKPPRSTRRDGAVQVHPRVCGEARRQVDSAGPDVGPSPRVRGSPASDLDIAPHRGSIPACAGKPHHEDRTPCAPGVHPRVCGEAQLEHRMQYGQRGPSPRVRGSLPLRGDERPDVGSIPACAGKPPASGAAPRSRGVHPRVCGEAQTTTGSPYTRPGPSPRVRGSPGTGRLLVPLTGSIPACAGKPGVSGTRGACSRVHPRVCGEAHRSCVPLADVEGPSPRVRGSRPPARGGPCGLRVHPRVCGEAGWFRCRVMNADGPSPRVRGSPEAMPDPASVSGSIPACAGKPRTRWSRSASNWVHPRVCGEASSSSGSKLRLTGPSPRVRGSLSKRPLELCRQRSIPACAGKPRPA